MSAGRIAVVDDDAKIRRLIRRCLEPEGYTVDEAADADELDRLVATHRYDLITLDLTLPDADGVEVARRLRRTAQTPIIMISGKGDLIDKVVGLEVGADDYMAKPFHVRELLARVRAVLRRATAAHEAQGQEAADEGLLEEAWQAGGLSIFPGRRAVLAENGREITLTTSEYNILIALVEASGRTLTRDALVDAMHGRHVAAFDRTVDNAVARLRKRLPRDIVKTVRGIGYQLAVPASRGRAPFPQNGQRHGD